MIINNKKIPILKSVGIYNIINKTSIKPTICFKTNENEFYKVSLDNISTTKQGYITIRDLRSGVLFANIAYVNFGSRGIEFANNGRLKGVIND